MFTDFEISKRLDEATISSRKFVGIIVYIGQQSFRRPRNESRNVIEKHWPVSLVLDDKEGVRESSI
ncbi:5261_t:CDS:2 [Gigaspora margarita]|uniref:5261_t:CDS:1 n=1 Tax=Gigaspora margarita TaxID=4874 RepID=A0ABN7W5Z8_GIGMA|nr:5261_t:CDS:2 [Gigaspora margarita]